MNHSAIANDELLFFLEGELPTSRCQELQAHITQCAECASKLEALRATLALLGQLDEEYEDMDLLSGVQSAIEEPTPRKVRRSPRWPFMVVGLGTVAAAASILLWVAPPNERADEFRARAASTATEIGAWVGVTAYRVEADTAVLLGSTMSTTDALAFAYRNAGQSPKRFLAVFAVDSMGGVHWYYPAFTDGSSDPVSVRIDPSETPRQLPDRVDHNLAPGPLTITALFTNESLRVSQIESAVTARDHGSNGKLPFEDAVQQDLVVQVAPH